MSRNSEFAFPSLFCDYFYLLSYFEYDKSMVRDAKMDLVWIKLFILPDTYVNNLCVYISVCKMIKKQKY